MTNEERDKLINSILPDTVKGQQRPAENLNPDMPYSTDFPQLINKDPASADVFNLMMRQLLSNDKELKKSATLSDVTTNTAPWNSTTTQYVANKSLVTYDQSLYLCLVTHTPSSSFEADLAKNYWKKVDSDQTVIGSNSGYSQITKKNITAPKTVSIAINNTPSLCLPPVEILKAGTQETNVSVKISDFSASDEAQFTHKNGVEFGDNGLKLKNNYNVAMTIPVALGSAGYISQSDEIDFSTYKSVEGVDV
nr:MAG TPA: hypothetical protein [Caudoviricetes sp.]